MRRATKSEFKLNQSFPKEYDLNKSFTGCAPCLKEALKIDREVKEQSLNENKIRKIKAIVRSIFEDSRNDTK